MNYCYELFRQGRNEGTLGGERKEEKWGCQIHGPRCQISDISSSPTTSAHFQ